MNSSQTPTARLLVKHWSMDDKETALVTILHGGLVEGEFGETDVLALLVPERAGSVPNVEKNRKHDIDSYLSERGREGVAVGPPDGRPSFQETHRRRSSA